jgi:hypothetical protein
VVKVKLKIKVRSPSTGKWKKVESEFDTEAEGERISAGLLAELGIRALEGENRYLEVEVAGEVLLWPFTVTGEREPLVRFGRRFIQTNGVLLDPSSRTPVRYAPGHPQPPVI